MLKMAFFIHAIVIINDLCWGIPTVHTYPTPAYGAMVEVKRRTM